MKTLKSKQEFERVFAHGKRANDKLVRMRYIEVSKDEETKIAFVAAKRLGTAVFRNRSKRMLREAARQSHIPTNGLQVILFATNSTYCAKPEILAHTLDKHLTKIGNS